ncbi:MAG: 2-succinyl-6-hydroxy-2,4-cyclohexadiene-1-carboxylate synthase [Alkalinema sp. CAN_BIN05]|nr:2-succinyl-6-hydroxy-2,4-cyclohexadiene-1-carboxylate synthase [Alkalinema sp. CAN_BIN05]
MSVLSSKTIATGLGNDRPTLVFLHGFLGSHQDFIHLTTQLNQYNCLLLDLPGHGKSLGLPDRTYTLQGAAEAILDTLDQCNIDRPILYGYYMGGRLALYLALRWPDRFAAAFLESSSPGLATLAEQSDRRQQDKRRAQSIQTDFSEFLNKWYQADLFKSLKTHPSFPEILDRRHQNDPNELARSLLNMGTGSQPSLWPELRQAKIPLHLIVGTADPKFCAINQKMQHVCPTAQLHAIPNIGHNLHIEAPDAIVEIILNNKLSSP